MRKVSVRVYVCISVHVGVCVGVGMRVGVREKMKMANRCLKKSEKVCVIKDGMGEW